jgi:hypothetical protein
MRQVSLSLVLLGLLLAGVYWLLFPLIGIAQPASVAARTLPGAFPGMSHVLWTKQFPVLVSLISSIALFDLHSGSPASAANLLLCLSGVAFLFLFLAVRACQQAVRARLQQGPMLVLLGLICLGTVLFGLFFLFIPGNLSPEILLSGLDGRLVLVYHVNPYLASLSVLAHDPLSHLLTPGGSFIASSSGPLWLDMAVPLAWLTQGNSALLLLAFRAFGLGVHILNALLIWGILAKLKPETRLTGTLLYAWNPAFLLLGVSESPEHLTIIFFLLLGTFFLQRRSLLFSWVALLLAALISPLCLLLAPLFLRVLAQETRARARGGRTLWWLTLVLLSTSVIALAYAPYWSGLGMNGIALHLRDVFWPHGAQHSLLTALSTLPFASWPVAAWLLTPQHWLLLPALIIGLLLSLGLWIADTLELALLFSSWIFLALVLLLPEGSPWLILLPLALSLVSASRRTTLLAHLLTAGALVAYSLDLWSAHWDAQALVTLGLPALAWGWALFFVSTWQMVHHDEEQLVAPPARKRFGISRPSWPSRPTSWPSRPGRGR